MEFITINKDQNEVGAQLEFLIRKEFYVKYNRYRWYPLCLLLLTIVYFLFLFFTSTDIFIIFKGVSFATLAIIWMCSLWILGMLLIKYLKRIIWKRKSVKADLLNNSIYQMAFDAKKLYFISGSLQEEIVWTHFIFYSKQKTHLFLFPAHNIYHAICVSESEIGIYNFEQLVILAKSKLILL